MSARDELKVLNARLDFIREAFVHIAEECHTLVLMGMEPEMSRELDRLDQRRRELGAEYRRIKARIREVEAPEVSAA